MAEAIQNVNLPEEVNISSESDFEDIEDLLSEQMSGIKLKQGIDISKLTSGEETVFEIDEDDLKKKFSEQHYYYNEDTLQHSKMELLGGSSSDEDDDNDDMKTFRTPFEKIALEMVDVTKDATGGILKKILKTGEGKLVPENASVTVDYNGYLEFSDEPFDSTALRGSQCRLRLNSGRVIDGLDKGIQTMRKKEKAMFLIQPEYAFGPMGCPPRVPPNATILFEVQLHNFIDDVALVEFAAMSPDEQMDASFSTLLKVCQADQQSGNEYFKQNQLEKAHCRYEHGSKLLEKAILNNEDEQRSCEQLQLKLYLNLSLVNSKLGRIKKSCRYARLALNLDKSNTKALYRLGHALSSMGEYDSAGDLLTRAKQNEPHNKDIANELILLNKRINEYKNSEKILCSRMFSNLSSNNKDKEEKKVDNTHSTMQLNVLEEFKEIAYNMLSAFQEDDEQKEMVLPEGLTPAEHAYIAANAKVFNLGLIHERHNGMLRVKIFKKANA